MSEAPITFTINGVLSEDFLNRLAEAIAKQNLKLGGVMPDPTNASPAPGDQATASTSAPADSQGNQDPWASTTAEAPGTTPQNAPQDPWSAGATTTPAAPASTETPDTPPQSGTITIQGQKGPREVTFGKYQAPPCKHGQPAAFTKFASGKGNWSCALSATKRWKDKCDFTQWA